MDGFTVERTFYCKELALIKEDQTYATSILFDLGLNWNQLNEKDQKTARYLEKYIHKIRFNSPSTVPVSNLPQIVREYFSEPNTLVAYKGGHYEKDLLHQRESLVLIWKTSDAPKLNSSSKNLDGWRPVDTTSPQMHTTIALKSRSKRLQCGYGKKTKKGFF